MIKVVSLSLVRRLGQPLDEFRTNLEVGIRNLPNNTDFCVLPEYCWGETTFNQILVIIEQIKLMNQGTCIVFGSSAFKINNSPIHNHAILLLPNGEIYYIPKSSVLSGEAKNQGVVPGVNNRTFYHKGVEFGVLICADLWNYSVLKGLILESQAKLLLIPALTVVPPGLGNYAKIQWYSLGISRSREFVVPLVISDHCYNTTEYDVGKVSCIVDPSRKSSDMQKIEDFIVTSDKFLIEYDLDLDKVEEYRKYRIDNGLLRY